MKKLVLLGISAVIFIIGLAPSATADAAPYCGITWGSLPKTAVDKGVGEVLTNVRTGRATCYDRMVVDVSKSTSGYDVRYVSNVYADGSGQLIPLAGGAKLRVVVKSPAYNNNYTPTYAGRVGRPLPGVNLTGYRTFKDAKFAGSFEGQSTIGLGVRAKLPFRVFTLSNRVVIDVAHQW